MNRIVCCLGSLLEVFVLLGALDGAMMHVPSMAGVRMWFRCALEPQLAHTLAWFFAAPFLACSTAVSYLLARVSVGRPSAAAQARQIMLVLSSS